MESGYFLRSDPSFSNIAFGNMPSSQFNPLLLLDHHSQGQNPLVTSLAQNPTPAIIPDRSLDSGRGPPSFTEANGYPDGAPFGRPRCRRSNSRKNRNRGQNANSMNKGYGLTRRSSEGHSSSSEESWNVEDLISVISSIPKGDSLGLEIYTAIRNFDSRLCSTLLKSLSKSGHSHRALEIFDWLRESFNDLADVFTYTAMISSCIHDQSVNKALDFVDEMHDRDIERNVHTYTALMNVCIKSGSCQLALDSFDRMKSDGIEPNVVTYNTLIDIYGKMGQWEQAIRVFLNMESDGIKPVLRTYNTLIISCNMCNQPREALAVYSRLLAEGFSPNATTFNALISAHGKAGQLDKVMDVFQEMIWKGCERTVITYSSLISACEKAGQWEVALQLFNEMQKEGCMPNTVTYNSLITACGQGAQWEKACEVFDQMRVQSCAPDVVTYTALITACERGGQWRRALQVYEQMLEQGCVPDAIVYNAIIDALWETGVIWAQRRALEIFKEARKQGHFQQQQLVQNGASVEVNLHALTAGVAVLSLYDWLVDLRILIEASGLNALPEKLFVVTDKGRNSKEQGNLIVKEAVAALLKSWESPFRPLQHSIYSGIMKASGPELAQWILSPIFQSKLFCFFPCTNIIPSLANKCPISEALINSANIGFLDDVSFVNEASVECRCCDAFAAVRRFESCHSLTVQAMGLNYLQHRAYLVRQILEFGKQLNQSLEVTHDAVLLMDRVMSTSIQIKENLLELLSVSCLVLSMKQSDPEQFPSEVQLEQVTDCRASAIAKMEFNLQQVLAGDSTAISTLRCVKLYLERLGTDFLDAESVEAISGETVTLVESSMTDLTFLNCRPSVIAAAILYAERRSRGLIPYWPSMLAKLTGYQDMSSPELTVAIKGAQKLCQQNTVTNSVTSPLEGLSLSTTSSLDINAMVSMSVNDHSSALFQSCPVSGSVGPVMGLEHLLNLDSTGSLMSLPSLQGLEEDHQITADRIDGVVVTQGATMVPRVVQSLTQMTSGFPTLLPNNGLIGSNLSMHPSSLFGITLSGSPTKNEVQEN